MALNCAYWMHKKSGVQISLKKWNAFVTDEYSSKPLYFERDGLVCTWSASSFCRNPLYFCTHAMWVKWWYHAKFQPFQRRWVFVLNPSYYEGDAPVLHEVHRVYAVTLSTFVHMLCGWNDDTMPSFNLFRGDEFSSETPHITKEMLQFYTKSIQFLP